MRILPAFSAQMVQSNLFDFTAKERTDEAIERANEHADPEWKALAKRWLKTICEQHQTFTVDTLCNVLSTFPEIETRNTSALGAVMRFGAGQNWMRQTGEWELSKDPKKHSRALRKWQSLIYRNRTDF